LPEEVDLIVATDGEAVLGIGDQGIGGINISVAKLAVYTLCSGINPHRVLPVQLDVGTNNTHLLADPMYLGWRHERISGKAYDDFIDAFVQSIKKKLPNVFLHWEDVGRDNARRILTRYQNELCTFNGDMQGTGAVALACVLAASEANKKKLTEQQIIIFGAGTAGVGIADQIVSALKRQGLSEKAAHARLWLIDKEGLLTERSTSLLPFQKPYARSMTDCANWQIEMNEGISLLSVIQNVKPTILIGCSTLGGAFTEEIVKTMAAQVESPIIMPLSNPTQKSEATPSDLIQWTKAKAIIATGSPFPEVIFEGCPIRISQSNNALAFPGIGLGAIAVKAKHLSEDMLWAATDALSQCGPILHDQHAPLLPKLSETKSISRHVALAVALQARKEGLAQIDDQIDLNQAINEVTWEPRYYSYRKT
jgi:malate dehydrogenase (oxaloacetate-decarboxylating)